MPLYEVRNERNVGQVGGDVDSNHMDASRTETPPVQSALDELRAKLGENERIDFAELVTLGAEVKVRRMNTEDATAAKARRRLAEVVRAGTFRYAVDVDAADEVKRPGLRRTRRRA